MSTRVSRSRGRLLSQGMFLGAIGLFVAGCSESSSRFDNLFTSSIVQPQPVSGGAYSNVLPHADLAVVSPRRVDDPQWSDPNTNLFNARNVSRQNNSRTFSSDPSSVTYANPAAQYGAPVASRAGLPNNASYAAQPSFNGRSIAAQPLPPVQSIGRPSASASFPSSSSGRLSLGEAQALSGRGAGAIDNISDIGEDSRAVAAAAPSYHSATQWTQKYSPVPTRVPERDLSSLAGSAPRAYTPPASTGGLDRLSTSSVSTTAYAPTIIKASINEAPVAQGLPTLPVDPQTVASTRAAPAQKAPSLSPQSGWSATGGSYVTLQAGETIYALSRRYGVPVDAINKANGISDPAAVRVGQQILIPTYVYSPDAPVSAPDGRISKSEATQRLALGAVSSSSYRVQKGDSLTAIAARHNMSLASLRSANGLHTSDVIHVGQVLIVDGNKQGAVAVPAIAAQAKAAPASITPRSRPTYVQTANVPATLVASQAPRQALPPLPSAPASKEIVADNTTNLPRLDGKGKTVQSYTPPKIDPVITSSAKSKEGQAGADASSGFIWPVRGEIISGFGSTQNGNRNDGIDVKVPIGTPVRAAASGDVIYASNGLADYGNLVLIRHSNGFVSAYAHNSALEVKRGDKVRQGEVIAKSGHSGSVASPRVHFEIRDGKTPINPIKHLPG